MQERVEGLTAMVRFEDERADDSRWGEEQLRNLEEATRDGIVTVDMSGRIRHANKGFLAMVGYTLEELRSMTYHDLTPARWHDYERAIVEERILPFGDSGEYEKEYRRKDGTVFPVSLRVWTSRDARGGATAMFGIVRDITERKHAEVFNAQLAAIVENSDDAILSIDLDGVIQTWNDGAARLYGHSAQEVIGQPVTRLIPGDRMAEESELLSLVAQGKSVKHFDTERLHKDGTVVPISLTISPIRDAAGAVVGASKVARDITERRRAERALRRADEQKDEFLAMLSHELRNPLASIATAAEVLARTLGPAPAAQAPLALLRRQAQQLTRIIDDLLDVSRIARGRVTLKREVVEIGHVVDEAAESVGPLLQQAGHRLVVSRPIEPLHVDADRARLVQCLGNILHNAAKYSDRGKDIEVSLAGDAAHVVVEIRDHGCGIAAELLPHVFELFVQSERTLDRSDGGLGIGLSVVKRLVEMHGGTVGVASAGIGRGSTFTVRLPRVGRPMPSRQPDRPSAPARRVLVVDDNVDAADGLAMLLRLDGHEVRTVYHAEDVLDAAVSFAPDFALLDIGLPRVDGYEVARRLRAHSATEHIRLVAITGYGQTNDIARARVAGFEAHVVKPADPEILNRIFAGGHAEA
ncbi:MAG TPA: PAS domain S-box protein [Steroidobacteraceae bacterium]|nr:PAS domain S-box protein [Steroidobacteraceae bacterium]